MHTIVRSQYRQPGVQGFGPGLGGAAAICTYDAPMNVMRHLHLK